MSRSNCRTGQGLEQRLDVLLAVDEAGPDAVIAIARDWSILFVNSKFFAMFGIVREIQTDGSARALLQQVVSQVVNMDSFTEQLSCDPGTLKTGQADIILNDGRTLDGSAAPLRSATGAILGRAWYFRDLTGTRKLLIQTQGLYSRLQELETLKNALVSNVSHELRTPLTNIRGYAEFLEDEIAGALTPQQRIYVSNIQTGAMQLSRLVDDLLDFSRLETGRFSLMLQHASLTARISEVAETFHPSATTKGITLTSRVPDEPVMGIFDPARIGVGGGEKTHVSGAGRIACILARD